MSSSINFNTLNYLLYKYIDNCIPYYYFQYKIEMERSNPQSFTSNTFETNENVNQRAMQEIMRYVK